MNAYYQIIILILLSLQITGSSGQTLPTNFNDQVPIDESITYGKLDNGLSYYIKHLPEPQDEVNLRFYISAGSNHQDSDQLNMAHFVEHMGFKSSMNFPNGIFSDLLTRKSLDMSQRDVNGAAGAYYTRYIFNAPADNQEALETGLLWFKDVATGLHFKNEEIDTERGVLIQEFISRTPEDMQVAFSKNELMVQLVPCRENYSNYIKHHKTFDPQRLKQFYKDWYRPDLMAVVIVGKIDDVEAVEQQVIDQFSDIPPKENPRGKSNCDALFFNQSPQFAVVEKELDSLKNNEEMELKLLFRDRKTPEMISSKEGIKRINKIGLLIKILNNRLRNRTNVYNSFFDIHVRHTHELSIAPSSFKVNISAHNNSEKEALQTLSRVLIQIRKHGVLDSEFSKVKEERLHELEETDSYESRYWLREIRSNVVHKEALPNDKRGYIKNWLSFYEKSELHEFIREINLEMPEDIGILAPVNHPALSYSETEIRALLSEVDEDSIIPYAQPEVPTALMAPTEVVELKEREYKDKGIGESGAREIILINGVKVVLKPLKDSPNPNRKRIVLHGFNNRGALNFPPEDYFSAINAPRIIRNSGVREFNKFDLRRYMKSNSLRFNNLYVNNQEAGIRLSADLINLEEMLQLVYLFLSEPSVDSIAFQDWKIQQSKYYQNRVNDSEKIDLDNNIKKILGDNSGVSSGTERYLGLKHTDMNKGFEIYKDLFGNAQDFTFLVTGNFSMDSVIPLINKYLGNLPSYRPGAVKTSNVSSFTAKPTGPVLVQLRSPDVNNKTKTNYTYLPSYVVPTKTQVNWKEKLIARALGGILDVKVNALRFEKGFSLYNVGAGAKYNNSMNQHEFGTTFRCTPEEYPLLRDEFTNIIAELKVDLVSKEVLEQSLKAIRTTENPAGRGQSLHKIHEKLYNQYRFGVPWVDQKEIMSYIESLTPIDILNAAQKYFKAENLYEFVMTN